ncbi:uncharacterized protein E0L32_008527 [Thyridium curvatum]|uniref:Uncharacterized protein n=1 Tax=Thyridium curvatum TaxID=1093900 RepID=A0A507ASN8_9PEZI|nr:uncharacterized protein E0L32_008527 [Thyridium curvatum]TPX10477.1 hypothetical protein E0L32_008527 [Thyridium curvatum]
MAPLIRRGAAAAAAVVATPPRAILPKIDDLFLAPRTPPAVAERLLSHLPSRTPVEAPSRVVAARDETTSTIPSGYGALYSGPDPGTVVGITLGAVAGFLLLAWLIRSVCGLGGIMVGAEESSVGTASVVTRKSRHGHHHHHHHGRDRVRRETVEVRTASRGPPAAIIVDEPGGERVERVVMEERRRRSVSRQPSVPPPPPRVVASDDDEVVVIEEHSPPRRHRSKRHSSGSRRESGYRDIDPDRFAGGDAPLRDPRRGSRRYSRDRG